MLAGLRQLPHGRIFSGFFLLTIGSGGFFGAQYLLP
jgi:hypothetical protein